MKKRRIKTVLILSGVTIIMSLCMGLVLYRAGGCLPLADDAALIAGRLNAIRNYIGKPMVVVIKSQTGAPIYVFSGRSVYWEVPDDLPKFTKLSIDGKPLYLHRANFQILDANLLDG